MKKVLFTAALSVALISTSFAGHQKYTTRTHATKSQTVVGAARSHRNLTTFYTAVKAAGLTNYLNKRGPFTVFAPTNRAFSKLPRGTLQTLLQPKNRGKLRSILMYHVVKKRLTGNTIRPGAYRTTLGKRIVITEKHGRDYINGTARISNGSIIARNGNVRVINKVLIPRSR